jgi:hypothetical protein
VQALVTPRPATAGFLVAMPAETLPRWGNDQKAREQDLD